MSSNETNRLLVAAKLVCWLVTLLVGTSVSMDASARPCSEEAAAFARAQAEADQMAWTEDFMNEWWRGFVKDSSPDEIRQYIKNNNWVIASTLNGDFGPITKYSNPGLTRARMFNCILSDVLAAKVGEH